MSLTNLGDYITTDSSELRYCCVFCESRGKSPDTKYHLYVNTEKGIYICHRCGARGKMTALDSELETRRISHWQKLINTFLGEHTPESLKPSAQLPDGVRSLLPGMTGWDYLVSRGFSPEIIINYRILDWQSRRRVIIPAYQEDTLVYWVARTYANQEPKYLNPKGLNRRNVLFNYDRASKHRTLIVTEGVLSAMAVGDSAVATLGKMVTSQQIDLLKRSASSEIIVMLDDDALSESVKLCKSLVRTKSVRLAVLPLGRDPADLTKKELHAVIEGAPLYDDFVGMRALVLKE